MAADLRQSSVDLRLLLSYWLENGVFDANAELKAKAAHFVNANYQYFGGDSFIEYELTTIHTLVNEVVEELALIQFKNFKNILEYQYGLYLKAVA